MSGELRDIYRYVNTGTAQEHGQGDRAFEQVNNTDLSDEDFYAQMQALQGDKGSLDYTRERTAEGDLSNKFNIREGSFLDRVNKEHGGVASFGASPYSEGSPGSGQHLSVDTGKLPQTRYGDISRTAAVDKGTKLRDPSMVYDDPVYGKITPLMNVTSDQEWLGPALMAAASMGMGSLMAPAVGAVAANSFNVGRAGLAAVNAARSLGGGDYLGAAGSLLGVVPGVSPTVASLARAGLAGARGNYGGVASSLLGAAGVGSNISSGVGMGVNLARELRRQYGGRP